MCLLKAKKTNGYTKTSRFLYQPLWYVTIYISRICRPWSIAWNTNSRRFGSNSVRHLQNKICPAQVEESQILLWREELSVPLFRGVFGFFNLCWRNFTLKMASGSGVELSRIKILNSPIQPVLIFCLLCFSIYSLLHWFRQENCHKLMTILCTQPRSTLHKEKEKKPKE